MGRGIIMSKWLRLPYYAELDKNIYYDDFIEKWFYGENRII